ncbi:unnamed protein product [Urochloa decumbens]|uniref:Uncharacterized protein n=1 Tax=Urochloa decumbens TaxID=240449 RepID=A0ABC8W877_9POAL
MDAKKQLGFIEEMTSNADAVQERVLAEILARNADAEYLRLKCGLGSAADRATFRAKVPMVEYEDLAPYIRRIANGDRSPILTGTEHPVTELFTSSGTSGGERKLIPVVEDEFSRRWQLIGLARPVIKQYVTGLDEGSGLYFHFVKSGTTTPGGLPARTALTSYYKSDLFQKLPPGTFTSPVAAILCEDTFQSMYAQLLCGLCQRHRVARVGAVFASGLLRAVRFFQNNWEQLAADIEAGTLTDRVTDPSVRDAVADVLRPDPELAQFIRAEGSSGDGNGIIARIWPNTKYLDTIVTGSLAQYVPTLNYYGGGLPIISMICVSSECSIGLNLRPMCNPSEVSYTIMPNTAYLEFLPVDAEDVAMASQLVELASVEFGHEYELVVTTSAGLCRYRVGDVLRVTGFYNATPQVRFVRRSNVVLSIESDKTDEADLQRAVDRAAALLCQHTVLDYTSRMCTETIPGHYVIYWELLAVEDGSKSMDGDDVLEQCCLEMEEAMNSVYRQSRVADGSIGPLEIRVIRPGTFEELADYAVSHGASIGQYKVPRRVTAPPVIHLLDSRVVSSHFSPAMPHWAPAQMFNSTEEKRSYSA